MTNRELVADAFEAWSRGEEHVSRLFAEDMTWELVGRSASAGRYGEGTTTAGTTHRNTHAWFLTPRDGLVVDGTASSDSIAFDELWESVTPRVTRSRR